jgi:hypothetical protein
LSIMPDELPAKPRIPRRGERRPDYSRDPRGIKPFIALVVALLALAGLWLLVQHMRSAAALQDCQMSGRRNCGREDDPDHL